MLFVSGRLKAVESANQATNQAMSGLAGHIVGVHRHTTTRIDEVQREQRDTATRIDGVQREQRDTASRQDTRIDEVQTEQRDTATRIDDVQREQRDAATKIDNVQREQRDTASRQDTRIDEVQVEIGETVARLGDVEGEKVGTQFIYLTKRVKVKDIITSQQQSRGYSNVSGQRSRSRSTSVLCL